MSDYLTVQKAQYLWSRWSDSGYVLPEEWAMPPAVSWDTSVTATPLADFRPLVDTARVLSWPLDHIFVAPALLTMIRAARATRKHRTHRAKGRRRYV